MKNQRLLICGLLGLAAACSDSGGISGTGGRSPGFAVGAIEGFGSVILNGVRFDTGTATLTVDGDAATQSDLRIGQVVEVQGDFSTGVATTVAYRSEIKGPVTSATVTNAVLGLGTFVVLGQTVEVDSSTVFDGTTLELVTAGDLLEVSGVRNSDGSVVATYVEAESMLPEYKVVGRASSVTATTFTIGALLVDYSSADTSNLVGGVVSEGDRVEVEAAPSGFTAPSSLVADEVETAEGPEGTEGARLELEGFITDFVSPADFSVFGYRVRTTGSTVFENGSALSLANGVKVEVEGRIASDGFLVAESCEIESTGAVRAEWEADAIDVAGSRLTVLGVQWEVRFTTELEDDSSAGVDPLELTDLSVGDTVAVRGFLDGGTPVAGRIEREDADTEAELRGPVTAITPGGPTDFEILGIGILSDGSTLHFDENDIAITRADFLSRLATGVFVEAEWDPFVGTAGAADELSLELDD
ncbi:MAG: DUF5666 domain-containing protein [Planctomycetota bacterium]